MSLNRIRVIFEVRLLAVVPEYIHMYQMVNNVLKIAKKAVLCYKLCYGFTCKIWIRASVANSVLLYDVLYTYTHSV